MGTEPLARSFATARGVLQNVSRDQLDGSTPCASWDLRRLVNHMIGGTHWFAMTTNAGSSPDVDETEDNDMTSGDIVATYDEGTAGALAAFGAPGALDKMITLPFGTFPGSVFMAFATMDHFAHAWDVARATGQSTDLDPGFATELLAQAQMMVPDEMRGPEGAPFGPIQQAPAGACAADQYAAFLGRTV